MAKVSSGDTWFSDDNYKAAIQRRMQWNKKSGGGKGSITPVKPTWKHGGIVNGTKG